MGHTITTHQWTENFSPVTDLVDEGGTAVILQDNKPKYIIMEGAEYEEIQKARQNLISNTADKIIEKHLDAFLELAK